MNIYKSIFGYKCPRCRKGDLFVKPFSIKNPLNMHKNCSVCGQDFEPEPGFYYGAMFLSYIVASFVLMPIALIGIFVVGLKVWQLAIFLVVFGFFFYLKLLRFSRSLFIHTVVSYDENAENQTESDLVA